MNVYIGVQRWEGNEGGPCWVNKDVSALSPPYPLRTAPWGAECEEPPAALDSGLILSAVWPHPVITPHAEMFVASVLGENSNGSSLGVLRKHAMWVSEINFKS